jgi:hypothetical protein
LQPRDDGARAEGHTGQDAGDRHPAVRQVDEQGDGVDDRRREGVDADGDRGEHGDHEQPVARPDEGRIGRPVGPRPARMRQVDRLGQPDGEGEADGDQRHVDEVRQHRGGRRVLAEQAAGQGAE